ncbi:MAG: type 1 glutamine amidotransferase [Pseudohongiellaceae bacterium]|jgi:type 1 glutamine amidotransferase
MVCVACLGPLCNTAFPLTTTDDPTAATATGGLPRALLLTHSAGYAHAVVTRGAEGSLSLVERSLLEGAQQRLDLTVTQDCAALTSEVLASLDLLIFYTTGELPLAPGLVDEIMAWVGNGGAFVGIHSASDTLYEAAGFLDMVGGTFDGHPWHETVTLRIEDKHHPATGALGDSWEVTDEIYQFRDFRRAPAAVLLSLTDKGIDLSGGHRPDGDYATAWCKPYGRGRVFYTALGHRPELWSDPLFLGHLWGGVEWAVAGPEHSFAATLAPKLIADLSASAAWTNRQGGAFAWEHQGDVFVAAPGAGDLVSSEEFGDALIHVEFAVPASGNSGVYIQGRYEVQIYETFGQPLVNNSCAALYGVAAPSADGMRRPDRWQSFDIRFRAPRFDALGKRVEAARVSVWHNGLLVQDGVSLPGPTPGGLGTDEVSLGPILLQDHGHAVRFRNLWVATLDGG